jgi:hypothetical protein
LSNHVGSSGVGKTSKRSGKEYVVTNPVKKKTSSIEDSVCEISESIESKLGEQDPKLLSRMEMMECMKTLTADLKGASCTTKPSTFLRTTPTALPS